MGGWVDGRMDRIKDGLRIGRWKKMGYRKWVD
jgi:hypothetical protein